MNIDIRTLAVILGITSVLQVFAFLLQYLVNKTYRGTGWWALGYALVAAGFSLLLLRDVVSVALISIILPNALLILGSIVIYIGTTRFLGEKPYIGVVLSILAAFLLSFFYYTYVNDDITARTAIVTATSAIISFMTAHGLFKNRSRPVCTSVYFTSAVFFAFGCFSAFRALVTLTLSPVSSLFTPSMMQASGLLVPLVVGILGTFGLIILVNQRLHEEMKEAKEQFEVIFNTSHDASVITRLNDDVIVDVNERFNELSGISRNEIIGRSALDVGIWVNPSDRQKLVHELKEKGYVSNYEAAFQSETGNQIIGIMSAKIIRLRDIPHVISVTRDITERKRVEEALRQSEKRYRLISENTVDVIWVMDVASQRIKYVSPSVQKLRGYTPEEIVGQPNNAVLTPESAKRVSELLAARIPQFLSGAPMPLFFTDEVEQPCKDGSIVRTEVTTSFLLNEQGEMEIVGVSRDVTERKRAEEALKESEERFRVMADGTPVMIWATDATGRVEFVNRACIDFLGTALEAVQSGGWKFSVHPDSKDYLEEYSNCLAQRKPFCAQARVRRHDGEWRWVESYGQPRFSLSGEFLGMVGSSPDITNRKRAEEVLRESEERQSFLLELSDRLRPLSDARKIMTTASEVLARRLSFQTQPSITVPR